MDHLLECCGACAADPLGTYGGRVPLLIIDSASLLLAPPLPTNVVAAQADELALAARMLVAERMDPWRDGEVPLLA